MPGGASNTGAYWITQDYADDLENFERKASALIPTDHLSYPLMQAGERFPFIASHAKGFGPESISKEESLPAVWKE